MRRTKIGFAILAAVGAAACSLLTDLTGFDSGGDESTPLPNRGSLDANADGKAVTLADGGGVAPDSGPFHPKYERTATVTNLASAELASGSTQCFLQSIPGAGGGFRSKTRADLADVRVFGPVTERLRSVDLRGGGGGGGSASGDLVSLCFSLERAIGPGAAETYVLRYGDEAATPPSPSEAALFPFWESFDGVALDGQRWLVNGTTSMANGLLTLPKGGQNAIATKAGLDDIPALASLEIRAQIVDPTSKGSPETDGGSVFYWWLGFQRKGDFQPSATWSLFIARSAGAVRAEHKAASGKCATTDCGSSDKAQRTDFRIYRIDRKNQQTELIDDEGISYVGEGTNGDESVMIRNWLVTSDVVIDWVRARPIVDPEPKLDIGPEELAP